jgi:hypothetical protein
LAEPKCWEFISWLRKIQELVSFELLQIKWYRLHFKFSEPLISIPSRCNRVDRLVTKHLSTQGRPNSRQGLGCFWCPNKTLTLPLGAFDILTIVENGLEMRKLWPSKQKVSRTQKKQITEHYKGWFSHIQIFLCMLVCYIRVQKWFIELKVTLL